MTKYTYRMPQIKLFFKDLSRERVPDILQPGCITTPHPI